MKPKLSFSALNKQESLLFIILFILLVLWIPVTIDKVSNFASFKYSILQQPFPDWLGLILIYSLPIVELIIVICLVIEKFRKIGLLISSLLMAVFSGYIGIGLLGYWEKLPCGCGSVISGMTWKQHFFFNLTFLLISGLGLYLWYKLRHRNAGREPIEGGSAKRRINSIV
ncbi:MauE/DoxX family redox-associated membrane protein [Polluticaenibacter yanchengensis]|uniref:Methylamine utilisation protein MauE domain-containing protein n=1 Tax=Polluticaenibacter yanchengensis TaxID=3014562 RepID=A0ABT4UNL2_9BACT|nr:hypothetical protein [Chitinophagaceae bacterium LY-5]